MTREQLQTGIASLSETIKAGRAWEKERGTKEYTYSAQAKADAAQLRVFKKRLAALDAPAPRMANVLPFGNR